MSWMLQYAVALKGVFLCISIWHAVLTSGVDDVSAGHELRHGRCQFASWEYKPSALEKAWSNNITAWQGAEYCNRTNQFSGDIHYWLDAVKELMASTRTRLLRQPEGHDVFSSFVSTYKCHDGGDITHTSWIEPLAFSLRFPTAPCNWSVLEGRDYMLLASKIDTRVRQQPCGSPRAYLFDLGASTWAKGAGGPSQSFLIEAYKRRGINFDRILLWEAAPHTVQDIYSKVPNELHAVYQYMNFPVTTEKANPANPLNIIKAIAQEGDFVVVKLDIDNSKVENELVNQILADSGIYLRIDEFFFEQHVNFAPMLGAWGTSVDANLKLEDSYKLFIELRKRGIRAHGWP